MLYIKHPCLGCLTYSPKLLDYKIKDCICEHDIYYIRNLDPTNILHYLKSFRLTCIRFIILFACSFHVKHSSTWTPRNFVWLSFMIQTPPTSRLKHFSSGQYLINTVLVIFKDNLLALYQFISSDISCSSAFFSTFSRICDNFIDYGLLQSSQHASHQCHI